ncbi:MAG: PepSY domain-containing protein [Rhodocyclaceae bacterium]|nr:PepSY domain-containing protein [Rhodocyclaceae bacterium]
MAMPAVSRGRGPVLGRAWHRALAWTLGFVFILQGLSGSLLVVAPTLDEWLNPAIAAAAGSEEALLRAADRLERERPDGIGMGVQREGGDGKLLIAFWPTPDPHVPGERLYWLARLHPDSGESLVERPYGAWPQGRLELFAFVHAIHTNLTLGAIGKFFQIGAAVLLLLLLWSGVRTWLARRRALRGKPADRIRDTRSGRLHRGLGLGAAAILALLLASGIALQFETVLDRSFALRSEDAGERRLSLRQAWQAAKAHYPDSRTRLVMAPFVPGGAFRVDLIPTTGPRAGETQELFLDARSGQLLAVRNDGSRRGADGLVALLEPIHGGSLLGAVGELLAFLAGLVPAAMLLSGYLNRRAWGAGAPGLRRR